MNSWIKAYIYSKAVVKQNILKRRNTCASFPCCSNKGISIPLAYGDTSSENHLPGVELELIRQTSFCKLHRRIMILSLLNFKRCCYVGPPDPLVLSLK